MVEGAERLSNMLQFFFLVFAVYATFLSCRVFCYIWICVRLFDSYLFFLVLHIAYAITSHDYFAWYFRCIAMINHHKKI